MEHIFLNKHVLLHSHPVLKVFCHSLDIQLQQIVLKQHKQEITLRVFSVTAVSGFLCSLFGKRILEASASVGDVAQHGLWEAIPIQDARGKRAALPSEANTTCLWNLNSIKWIFSSVVEYSPSFSLYINFGI